MNPRMKFIDGKGWAVVTERDVILVGPFWSFAQIEREATDRGIIVAMKPRRGMGDDRDE